MLLLLVPGLLALVAAVVTARILTPALRLAGRTASRVPIALRLAALSAGRRAGQSTLAAAFVVVSVGIGVFATNYRSTLAAGQRESVDYETPYPLMLSEDFQQLVSPASIAPQAAYPGKDVVRSIRLAGSIARLEGDNGTQVVGLTPSALPRIRGWRSDFSALGLSEIARRITPSFDTTFGGVPLPSGTRSLTIPIRSRGAPLALSATLMTTLGQFVSVDLGTTHGMVLRARIPQAAIGGTLISLQFEQTDNAHQQSGEFESAAVGEVTLGPAPGLNFNRFVGVGGLDPVAHGDSVRVRFTITTEAAARLRAREPVDRHVLPAIVSPRLAKAAGERGLLPVEVVGSPVVMKVVGVARHFPSTHDDFVVTDRSALAAMMNTFDPTTPFFNELWIDDPNLASVRKQLHYAPFDQLSIRSRSTVHGETSKLPSPAVPGSCSRSRP